MVQVHVKQDLHLGPWSPPIRPAHPALMGSVTKPKRQLRRTFLREWRKFKNMTQEQAAEPLNMDPTTLSKIERGLVPYSQQLLEAAAELFGCEPVDLLIRDPLDPDGIWSIWDHAKPGEKKQIVEVSRVIVGGRTGTEG